MNHSMPRIAVLLAAYNGVQWLESQIDSILEQQQVAVTVFISVDQSSDGTEALVTALAAADERIIALPYGRKFGGAAPNFFRLLAEVDVSAFAYVAFADQDDLWFANKLSRAVTRLSQTGADAYSSNVTAFWPDGRQALIVKSQPQQRWDFLFEAAGPGCTYLFSRELAVALQALIHQQPQQINKVGLHDWFCYAFARAQGYQWLIDDFSGLRYRQHQLNQVGVNKGIKAFLHRAQRILDGWAFQQTALIVALTGLAAEPFVRRCLQPTRCSRLQLALHAPQCRRRLRDQFLFALSCLAALVIGVNN